MPCKENIFPINFVVDYRQWFVLHALFEWLVDYEATKFGLLIAMHDGFRFWVSLVVTKKCSMKNLILFDVLHFLFCCIQKLYCFIIGTFGIFPDNMPWQGSWLLPLGAWYVQMQEVAGERGGYLHGRGGIDPQSSFLYMQFNVNVYEIRELTLILELC